MQWQKMLQHPFRCRRFFRRSNDGCSITMGTLRFSIGLEHTEDIIAELDEALLRI